MPVSLKAWNHFKFIFKVYILGIAFFTFFRLLILATNFHSVEEIQHNRWSLIGKALVMGFRFDTVISCYILGLPIVILSVVFLAGHIRKGLLNVVYSYVGIFFVFCYFLCSVDVPFFNYFFNRLNDTVFNWAGNAGFGFKMVIEEPRFLGFFFVFLLIAAGYVLSLRRILKGHKRFASADFEPISGKQLGKLLPFVLLLWSFVFLGIRGRTEAKSPIAIGTAFFSNNAFINQLGLNPVFSLLRSVLDDMQPENQHFHKLSDNVALNTMSDLLHGDPSLKNVSPIARWQSSDAPLKGRNVVVVIMESMTTAKMGRFGNNKGLTPFLDSLAGQCWAFDNIYSAGIHTYNGIYTTMFAHPAIMKRHTMEQVRVPKMAGLPNILAAQGYQTMFFTTHDELFDNMSGFLSANEFQHIVGQKDYPSGEVKSTLGVPDEYMFRFSMNKLNELAAANKPFLATFMTGSDHDPVVIPEGTGFTRRHKADKDAVVSYADWSLKKFIEYSSKQSWFNNTVFVFVADHGAKLGLNAYDVLFSYHHIPFLVYAPGYTQPQAIKTLGLQADVFPTVTSLLVPNYMNNTFGVNLLKDKRSYVVFSADDKLACMNDSLLYIFRTDAEPSLYKYAHNSTINYSSKLKSEADKMNQIAFSWLQTSEWMLAQGKAEIGGSVSKN